MTNAELNRQVGMGMLMELYIPASHDYELTFRHGNSLIINKVEMAASIRKLAQLGRTARWQTAIESWALMVLAQQDLHGIRWAIIQGCIGAGHAA